jgi:MoxR domain in the MoxR-vWA-beta-propeller ternary systems
MSKYRFKTLEEFKEDSQWVDESYVVPLRGYPEGWANGGEMNKYIGQDVPDEYNSIMESNQELRISGWVFSPDDYVLNEPIDITEVLEQVKQLNSLKTKEKMATKTKNAVKSTVAEKFVFMDKTVSILNVGFSTAKNVVLYGPGGHGKSEITLDFLKAKGINPFIQTMGTGMTTDRLFGGLDIPTFETTGKIEYLVENSFMNHEYVIFEELFDAPDFILEQLKDILSSGVFRNGTQIFPINTKFIICCTNRTRDEFSKNMSLKALMERFPLELNVIWDNYTEITYNKLLESKFGEGEVDPVIPYLLQEYAKNGITISPRVAVTAYQVYDECGPESLSFIAEFAKKPSLIAETIKKFESTIKFRDLSSGITDMIETLNSLPLVSKNDEATYKEALNSLTKQLADMKGLVVGDDVANVHAQLVKAATSALEKFNKNLTIASFL